MRGRLLTRTSSMIMLALAGALAMATLASAAGTPLNFNVTAMPGNEAENAIAVNPTNPSNVVAMSTLPDVVAGLAVGVSFDGGQTWSRRVIVRRSCVRGIPTPPGAASRFRAQRAARSHS